jgi:hypothetical protein
MEVTPKQLIEMLDQSGYHYTERQLTDLRSKQLLPPLERRQRPGLRKPVYVWDDSVADQAAYVKR